MWRSPTWRSAGTPASSRSAPSPAPSGWRNGTRCCASRRRSATAAAWRGLSIEVLKGSRSRSGAFLFQREALLVAPCGGAVLVIVGERRDAAVASLLIERLRGLVVGPDLEAQARAALPTRRGFGGFEQALAESPAGGARLHSDRGEVADGG